MASKGHVGAGIERFGRGWGRPRWLALRAPSPGHKENPRLRADPQLGRFWAHRGEDGVNREKQLLIDFLCASAGGPVYYRGRDMVLTHRGMRISEGDWERVPRSCGRDLGEVPGA